MQDINLYHLLKFYAKKWLWIIIFTVIGAGAGFIYTRYIQVPLYKSDATLLLVSTDDKNLTQDTTLINNYLELLKSRRVLEPVIDQQGDKISYNELAASTTATNEKSTEVIKLSIASKDPQMSKNLVDGVVASFRKEAKNLYKVDNISVVDNASQENQPYNVHTVMLIALTTAAGFFTSIILLFFAYDLGIMKKSAEVMQATSAIKRSKPARQGGLVNKIVAMLVGAEVESTPNNSQESTTTAVINDQRHKPIVIVPPSEVKQAKPVKKSKRKK